MCEAIYNDGETVCVCRRDGEHVQHIGIVGDNFVMWTDTPHATTSPAARTAAHPVPGDTKALDFWICAICASVNEAGDQVCWSCDQDSASADRMPTRMSTHAPLSGETHYRLGHGLSH